MICTTRWVNPDVGRRIPPLLSKEEVCGVSKQALKHTWACWGVCGWNKTHACGTMLCTRFVRWQQSGNHSICTYCVVLYYVLHVSGGQGGLAGWGEVDIIMLYYILYYIIMLLGKCGPHSTPWAGVYNVIYLSFYNLATAYYTWIHTPLSSIANRKSNMSSTMRNAVSRSRDTEVQHSFLHIPISNLPCCPPSSVQKSSDSTGYMTALVILYLFSKRERGWNVFRELWFYISDQLLHMHYWSVRKSMHTVSTNIL